MLVKQQFDSRLVRVNQVSSTVGNVKMTGRMRWRIGCGNGQFGTIAVF
jgi:hypothetical protein